MNLILSLHNTTKYKLINFALFAVFLLIYTVLDINAVESYSVYVTDFGVGILIMHLLLNFLISAVSSVVITWSFISLSVYKKDVKGTNLPFVGVVIGFLTFGCTPCVVAFLAIFGITFVPLLLPNGNLLWKVLVLLIIIVSGIVTIRSANKGCTVKIKK